MPFMLSTPKTKMTITGARATPTTLMATKRSTASGELLPLATSLSRTFSTYPSGV